MKYALLLLVACGGSVADALSDAQAPACEAIEAGPCYAGWSTLQFVKCEPGARPADETCVQDDSDASPYWCCPVVEVTRGR